MAELTPAEIEERMLTEVEWAEYNKIRASYQGAADETRVKMLSQLSKLSRLPVSMRKSLYRKIEDLLEPDIQVFDPVFEQLKPPPVLKRKELGLGRKMGLQLDF